MTKLRAQKADGSHAFWLNQTEAADLVRAGLARTFGTKHRVVGLRLLCSAAEAGAALYGSGRPPVARNGIVREHVAERFYIYQHAPVAA